MQECHSFSAFTADDKIIRNQIQRLGGTATPPAYKSAVNTQKVPYSKWCPAKVQMCVQEIVGRILISEQWQAMNAGRGLTVQSSTSEGTTIVFVITTSPVRPKQVRVQLPTSAVNVALPAIAAAGLLLWAHAGTDRRTDIVSLHRPCSTHYAGSGNKRCV